MGGPRFSERGTDIPSFVRSVLKERENELDRMISKLSGVTERLRDQSEIAARLERAKENLETLRVEIHSLLKCRFDDF